MLTLSERARAEIETFADQVIAEIQENIRTLPVYQGRPANASGETAASLRREWQGDLMVISGAGHIFVLEFGRKPTMLGGSAGNETLQQKIRKWMDDKNIATSEPDKKRNSISWAIATKIHKEGSWLYRQLKQGGSSPGTLKNAINEKKIIELGKKLLGIFAVEARSLLLNAAKN